MLRLLAPLLSAAATGEITNAVGKAKRSVGFILFITLFALIGGGFALLALYIWLSGLYGNLMAAGIIAAASFVLALAVFITMKITESAKRKRQQQGPTIDSNTLLKVAAIAAAPGVLSSRSLMMLAVPIAAAAFLLMPKKHDDSSGTE
ncbi:MAG: hypothetical protein ACRECW_03490 [Phyllobacterium sp.]